MKKTFLESPITENEPSRMIQKRRIRQINEPTPSTHETLPSYQPHSTQKPKIHKILTIFGLS